MRAECSSFTRVVVRLRFQEAAGGLGTALGDGLGADGHTRGGRGQLQLAQRGRGMVEEAKERLEHLRALKPVCAVGIAYAAQEFPKIPNETHDESLDYVLTERELIDCRTRP